MNEEKEASSQAEQVISPAGLANGSDKITTLPGNHSPDDTPSEGLGSQRTEGEQDCNALTTSQR